MEATGPRSSVELSAGAVSYVDEGSAPVLVFVHGLLVNGLLWRKVTPLLSDRFRCIVPDWPLGSHPAAMKRSADLSIIGVAALVAEFMEKLDLHDVTLVGNDTGGALCQMVAVWHGGRVARLVLTPCDCFEDDLPAMFKYFKLVARIPGATWILAKSMAVPMNRRLPIAYGWLGRIPDEITAAYAGPVGRDRGVRRDVIKFIRSISRHHTQAAADDLRLFRKPALIVWPRRLHFFPFANAERLAQALPNARLEATDGSQAFVPEDQPARLAELIAGFAA